MSLLFCSQVTTQSVLVHLSRNNITLIDITVTQRSRLFSHIFYGFCHKTILGFFLIVRVNAEWFYLFLYSKTPRALSLSSLEFFTLNLFLDRLLLITRQYKGWLYIPRRCFFVFLSTFSFVEPDQKCALPLVKNGKVGNTSCLISNLNILGYMNML